MDLNEAKTRWKDIKETNRKLRQARRDQSHKVQALFNALKDCTVELDDLNDEKKRIYHELTETRLLLSGGGKFHRLKVKLRRETGEKLELQQHVKEMKQDQQYLIARFREASSARQRLEHRLKH